LPGCVVHRGIAAVEQGERATCQICVYLMAKIRISRKNVDAQCNIEMCWESDETRPKRLHFAVVHRGFPRATNSYVNILRLRLWPHSEVDFRLLSATEPSRLERTSNTGGPWNPALHWLRRCQANADGMHEQCNRACGEWLPMRLLDVESAVATSKLKLVLSRNTPQAFVADKRYVTLSHCWGQVALPVLTTGNMAVRLRDGIAVSLLPGTFRDAIQVAHWFHGEYPTGSLRHWAMLITNKSDGCGSTRSASFKTVKKTGNAKPS
jgi:hypothetical protein